MSGVEEEEEGRHGGPSSFLEEEVLARVISSSFGKEDTFTLMVDAHAKRE